MMKTLILAIFVSVVLSANNNLLTEKNSLLGNRVPSVEEIKGLLDYKASLGHILPKKGDDPHDISILYKYMVKDGQITEKNIYSIVSIIISYNQKIHYIEDTFTRLRDYFEAFVYKVGTTTSMDNTKIKITQSARGTTYTLKYHKVGQNIFVDNFEYSKSTYNYVDPYTH